MSNIVLGYTTLTDNCLRQIIAFKAVEYNTFCYH